MLRYKISALTIIYAVFLICDWNISNLPLIKMRELKIVPEEALFLSLLDSVNGYAGILQLLVVYIFPILLGVYFIIRKEKPAIILRYKKRHVYKSRELAQMTLVVVIFTGLHEIINIVFVNLHLDSAIIRSFDFPLYSLFTWLILLLFYQQVGLVFSIVGDLTKNKVLSFIITFLLYFIQFWICKFGLLNLWLPYKDLVITFEFLQGALGETEMVVAIIRSVLINFVLYAICQLSFLKKDLIKDE